MQTRGVIQHEEILFLSSSQFLIESLLFGTIETRSSSSSAEAITKRNRTYVIFKLHDAAENYAKIFINSSKKKGKEIKERK